MIYISLGVKDVHDTETSYPLVRRLLYSHVLRITLRSNENA